MGISPVCSATWRQTCANTDMHWCRYAISCVLPCWGVHGVGCCGWWHIHLCCLSARSGRVRHRTVMEAPTVPKKIWLRCGMLQHGVMITYLILHGHQKPLPYSSPKHPQPPAKILNTMQIIYSSASTVVDIHDCNGAIVHCSFPGNHVAKCGPSDSMPFPHEMQTNDTE